jgi:predicted lipid-binding transport protein (Tim44 family)
VLLLGCLLVIGFSIAPRVMLALAWLFSDRWQVVWGGEWFAPLLGIIFVPYTTIMYLLVWSPSGIEGWDWLWIILGLILDVMHWGQWLEKRRQVPGYSTATAAVAGSGSTGATSNTAPPSASASTPAAPPASAPSSAEAPIQAAPPVSAPVETPAEAPAEVIETPTEPKPASTAPGSPPAES